MPRAVACVRGREKVQAHESDSSGWCCATYGTCARTPVAYVCVRVAANLRVKCWEGVGVCLHPARPLIAGHLLGLVAACCVPFFGTGGTAPLLTDAGAVALLPRRTTFCRIWGRYLSALTSRQWLTNLSSCVAALSSPGVLVGCLSTDTGRHSTRVRLPDLPGSAAWWAFLDPPI